MNFEELSKADAQRRADLDRRVTGKAPAPDVEATTPEGETPDGDLDKVEQVQRGDGGGVGRRASTESPGEAFNRAVRSAVGIGRRRQHARRSKPGLIIGGEERRV